MSTVIDIAAFAADQVKRRRGKFVARLQKWLSCGAGPLPGDGACVTWTGVKTEDGYPKMNVWFNGRVMQIYIHRLFWVLVTGKDIPDDLEVDHICRRRNCVRFDHMQLVTRKQNAAYVRERAQK